MTVLEEKYSILIDRTWTIPIMHKGLIIKVHTYPPEQEYGKFNKFNIVSSMPG
jgi:hypothetical protein